MLCVKKISYSPAQLLHPNCSRYLSPDDLSLLDSSIPSLLTRVNSEPDCGSSKQTKSSDVEADVDMSDAEENLQSVEGGKKDPLIRRRELLVDSGLAESLIDACCQSAEELLRSNHGKEVLYEVASRVAQPKSEGQEEEHLLENFHSSRAIKKLILDCPSFASTLWEKAFKGTCETWAQGHSAKVVCAYLESSDHGVRELAMNELKPLLDTGVPKLLDNKQPTKAD